MGIKGKNLKKIIFERDKGVCQRCGTGLYFNREDKTTDKLKAHIHHKQHKIDGGRNTEDNLHLTCWPCERKYHAKNKHGMFYYCEHCKRNIKVVKGLIVHDDVFHPQNEVYGEEHFLS
jgi:5-methylcytosine-specific restriction endonuclease McrA